jgi:hypothetical protein
VGAGDVTTKEIPKRELRDPFSATVSAFFDWCCVTTKEIPKRELRVDYYYGRYILDDR